MKVFSKTYFEQHQFWIFGATMIVCFLVGLLGVFWGFDICDSGFYLTFYDNIFNSPQNVEYNFMYYLSGIVGGTIKAFIPSIGMAGMRMVGLLTIIASMVILYLFLKNEVNVIAFSVGCIIIMVSYTTPLFTFNHDLLTVFFYTIAIVTIVSGICKHSFPLLFIGGVIIGLNSVTRIPNVLSAFLMILPLVNVFYHKLTWRQSLAMVGSIFGGIFISLIAIIAIMKWAGHWELFFNNMNDLFTIASSNDATHSSTQLITTQIDYYKTNLWSTLKLGTCIVVFISSTRAINNNIIKFIINILCIAAFCYMAYRMNALNLIWLVSIVGCIYTIISSKSNKLILTAVAALLMMTIFPIGSDYAYNSGSIIALCATPIACSLWTKRNLIVFTVCLFAIFSYQYFTSGSYFDDGPLTHKQATINSPKLNFIHTTSQRAKIINDLLDGIKPFVKSGDEIIVYGSMPTVHFLTSTRPAIGCSWPELLNAQLLNNKLSKCKSKPIILRQKFNTIGNTWETPSPKFLLDYDSDNDFLTNDKLQVINNFIASNGYNIIWKNSHFALYRCE